ncbi:hypothetical protein [Sorangium sp. So ce1389]|uniref:hypothetical protein n=1 Tax=Sorangium sp. So ce1389 TaxID=3133336 RepID=UPI003F634D86
MVIQISVARKIYLVDGLPSLLVDVDAGHVQLGPATLREQWVDFYALLALVRLDRSSSSGSSGSSDSSEGAFLSAEELGRVGPWRHKAAASVGKEVARHLAWLERQGLAQVVSSKGRTKSWRLALSPASVRLRPDRASVEGWIRGRASQGAAEETWIDDLQRLAEATAALQQGQAESVVDRLQQPLSYRGEPALEAWAALLSGRAAFQHDDHALLVDLYESWLRRPDAVGRTVGARLRALVAYKNRFDDPAGALASLRKLAADLELGGDVSALASVLNIAGLLATRTGEPRAGVVHHLRAAALFGIVGDYPSLQGALFNLANCRRQVLQKAGQPPDETVFTLVELCRLICRRFGVGADSAQAEIAAARWSFEAGDWPRARHYLAEAEALVRRIESVFDQACFLLLRAEMEHEQSTGASDPLRDLHTAERLFRDVQDERSASQAQRLIKAFSRRAGGRAS